MTALEQLLDRVSPPAGDRPAIGDWHLAERQLGTRLPQDYKDLVTNYGSGEFCGYLYWLNPFYERPMREEADVLIAAYEAYRDVSPEACPWPPFPAPGGVLPWATTPDGAALYWLTSGRPDEWSVVAADLPATSVHRVTSTEFLVGWLDGRVGKCAIPTWPQLQPGMEPYFRPLVTEVPSVSLTLHFAHSDLPRKHRVGIIRRVFAPTKSIGQSQSALGLGTKLRTSDGWFLTYFSPEPGVYASPADPGLTLGIILPWTDLASAKVKVVRLRDQLGTSLLHASTSEGAEVWPDIVPS